MVGSAGSKQDESYTRKTSFENKGIKPVDNNNKLVCFIEQFHHISAQHYLKVERLISKMKHI
ncbi:MAG: hypothetical protein J6O41_07255 [Clostridia bacterium]|nr:hypothetical protein [Clostridia bacterium]